MARGIELPGAPPETRERTAARRCAARMDRDLDAMLPACPLRGNSSSHACWSARPHNTVEEVKATCSFARAERLLGREYHGRFLIELLQNAADAWRRKANEGQRCEARVVLDVDAEGPALIVANHGEPFPPQVVLDSLGQIGSSTKDAGEAIGHKGIGFKSVLELSRTPELYSQPTDGRYEVSVRFDAGAAERLILDHSTRWLEGLSQVRDVAGLDAIPVLRFPTWVVERRGAIGELAAEGFSTAVRLPYTGDPGGVEEWLATVRRAIAEVSDQILLLLGTFDRLTVDDRPAGTRQTICPRWTDVRSLPDGAQCERIEVSRDGASHSTWLLYRRDLPGERDLASEMAVGIRCDARLGLGPLEVIRPDPDSDSTPFHLFFPTRISSGLPFLLHGYFEVDAARTGFYRGSSEHNDQVLGGLARLTADAVADAGQSGAVDMASLVNLVAQASPPDDPRAQAFQSAVFDRLDSMPWVPTSNGSLATPADVLLTSDERIDQHLESIFAEGYVRERTELDLVDRALRPEARQLLRARRAEPLDAWEVTAWLMRPGDSEPWPQGEQSHGFRALLDLVTALEGADPHRADALFGTLRGDVDTRLLPVYDAEGFMLLLPLPDPATAGRGRRSTLVMSRIRGAGDVPLHPPSALQVAFLPDGLLASEAEVDRAKPLGVRPFTVDSVLDRLDALGDDADPSVVTFLWQLLSGGRTSEFSTRAAAERAQSFDPSEWFWCQPGRGETSEADQTRQRREQSLSRVRLPAQDGSWQPSGELAFGKDWAEWIEATFEPLDGAMRMRAETYRDLEVIAPGRQALLAPPETVVAMLAEIGATAGSQEEPFDDGTGADMDRQRLAFLLRLGVWEVPPVAGHHTLQALAATNGPWAEERERLKPRADGQPWNFGVHQWGGRQHHNITVSQDYRLRWPLEIQNPGRRMALNRAIAVAAPFYRELSGRSAFCPRCGDSGTNHTRTYRTAPQERRPSTLQLQLQGHPWLATTVAGEPADAGVAPSEAWYVEKPPTRAGMATSPMQFLAIADAEVAGSAAARGLLGLADIAHAPADRLEGLLRDLRKRIKTSELPKAGTSGSRQALIGLHRLAYERLAELGAEGARVTERVGVLCERGNALEYRPPGEARHDDGRQSTYKRHFAALVPFVVLPRDKSTVATALGVPRFDVTVARRGTEAGEDVTTDLADALALLIPEFLAVLVHHSLGVQTLDPLGKDFGTRSRRLQALTVRRVKDLVLDLSTDAADRPVTLGEGTAKDLFLENPTSAAPVLFHDLEGDDWAARIRQRLAPQLAELLENPAYAATFQVLLMAETEGEREDVLHDLAITPDDVDDIRRSLGALTEDDRRTARRWFAALVAATSGAAADPATLNTEPGAVRSMLAAAGVPDQFAARLADAGGSEAVRRQGTGVLADVAAAGIDLRRLDEALRALGDQGLTIAGAADALRTWRSRYGQRVAAVLAQHIDEASAKQEPATWQPPADLRYVLDPPTPAVLEPVAASLRSRGLPADARLLAEDPVGTLIRLADVPDEAELNALVTGLYDEEERRRQRAHRARQWVDLLVVILVLARSAPGETQSAIRGHAELLRRSLPAQVSEPTSLRDWVHGSLLGLPGLASALAAELDDAPTAPPPDQARVLDIAVEYGLDTGRTDRVRRALTGDSRQRAERLRDLGERMAAAHIEPLVPPALAAVPPAPPADTTAGPRQVVRFKVDPSMDRRKRKRGEEGEDFALSSALAPLLALDAASRECALLKLGRFLETWWKGDSVQDLLHHRNAALQGDLDDDDLAHELASFLHASERSDAFGFDMLGWLPVVPGGEPRPMALEVKNSGDTGFLMSAGEWGHAVRLHNGGSGGHYAVLVVRTAKNADLPIGMDLLVDPVRLLDEKALSRQEDGYRVTYHISDRR